MNRKEFGGFVEKIVSGKENEIDLSSLDRLSFFLPDCLFIGSELNQDELSEEEPDPRVLILDQPYKIEDIISVIFGHIVEGLNQDILIESDEKPIELLMAIDCLYGILVQIESRNKQDEKYLTIGSLSFWFKNKDPFSVVEHNEFLGSALLQSIGELLNERAMQGAIGFYEIHKRMDDAVPFFLLLPNIFVYEDSGADDINAIEPFVNYDIGYGSLLGWYRFERLMVKFFPSFRLDISDEDRHFLQTYIEHKLNDFEWVYNAVEEIINEEGRQIYKRLINIYRDIYTLE
jgi:hypothetical protein